MHPRLIGSLCVAFGLGLGGGLLLFSSCGQAASVIVRYSDPPGQGAPRGQEIRVYVSGAVHNPGVYSLRDGDRVVEAVEAAGGPAAEADTEAINFAQRLRDEAHLHVPRLGEATVTQQASATGTAVIQPVDINRADANLLRSLPGIGTARADSIVASRQKDGPFKSTQELLSRKLVPQNVYDQVKDLIEVAP